MKTTSKDTIAAISTAMAPSGIGIVRISGPAALPVADRLFRAKSGRPLAEAKSHTLHYGHIEHGGRILDEVLVSVFRAPATYTREDLVEINGHGGILILRQILEAVLSCGARLAAPGEFTKRAFLNGRIDLSQAEAVMDLIASENKTAAASALAQLSGAMRRRVVVLRDQVLHETAYIEAALDDPEHYDLTGYAPALRKTLQAVTGDIDTLLASAEDGRIIKEGLATVILGRPNVGKSTLLNLLAGEDRAIVTEIAGTTRDVLEEQVTVDGIPLRIMDTAGLRETKDTVEQIGVARAREAAAVADLILYVLNGAEIFSEEDRKNLQQLAGRDTGASGAAPEMWENIAETTGRASGASGAVPEIRENSAETTGRASDTSEAVPELWKNTAGAPVILVLNKGDLRQQLSEEEARSLLPGAPLVKMAAREGFGLQTLAKTIRTLFFRGEVKENQEVYITNLRHKESLLRAKESLAQTIKSIDAGMPEDLYAVDLMDAYAALGEILGEEVSEDLIDRIFSEFCMGK